MATIYLRSSDGDDGDDGSTWALAKATWQAAKTAAGAGGTIYMDEDHIETFAIDVFLTSPGTLGAPVKTYVVQTDTTTLVSAPNSTANYEITSATKDLYLYDVDYAYGISIKVKRSLLLKGVEECQTFENSRIIQTDSGSSGRIRLGADGTKLILIDCTLSTYSMHGSYSGIIILRGCVYEATATAPTTLFYVNVEGNRFIADGNDFSAYTGTNIFNFDALSGKWYVFVEFINNRMPSSFTWTSGRPNQASADGLIRCHANGNGDEYYQIYEDNYGGYVQESIAIDRVGGATYDGTNLFAVGLHGNANTSYITPLRHKLRIKPVDASSGATVAVHLAYDKATTLNNSDIGLELKYHDGTNEAHGKWVREMALSPLDSGDRDGFTDVSGSETWNQSFSNPNEETIEVDIPTGQGNGLVEVWVVLMSNETVYFCPEIEVS